MVMRLNRSSKVAAGTGAVHALLSAFIAAAWLVAAPAIPQTADTSAPPAEPVGASGPVSGTTPVSGAALRTVKPQSAPAPASVSVSASAPVLTGAANPKPISAEDIEAYTDSVVRTLMQRDHVLGVSVAVVQGNTPLLVKGYGYDRLSPARLVDPGASLFRIGSITKTLTWIVARQEIEAGRIKPDRPIADYLPADVFSEDRRFKPIRMIDLMDHASGYDDTALGHLFQLDAHAIESGDSYFRKHKPRRVRDPGQFSVYSNFGAALAARALVQTGHFKDVPSLMEARLFQPLGLSHMTLREPYPADAINGDELPAPLSAALSQDMSDGFVWDGATYTPQPFDHAVHLAGALGASASGADMARLMSLMLGGGQLDGVQLYDANSAAAFRTPLLKMPEGYNGWASGLMIRTSPSGDVTYGHGGSTLWFNANMVLVPDLNLGIFISTNTQTGAALANSFPNLLLDHLHGDVVRPPLMPAPDMAYANHADFYRAISGKYVSTRRAYGGLEGAITRLINTVEVEVDADGRLILTTPAGLSAFVPGSVQGFFNPQDSEDPGPAQATGGLHFLFNSRQTAVTAFETASNMMRYERIDWIHDPDTMRTLSLLMIGSCVLVWVSLARSSSSRYDQPNQTQARATLISSGTALLWVGAIFIFQSWTSHLADDPVTLFTHWPSGQVRLASTLALLAAIGTLYQVFSLYFVCSDRGFHTDGWPLWQKIAHGTLIAYWAFYVGVMILWGALEPWSW